MTANEFRIQKYLKRAELDKLRTEAKKDEKIQPTESPITKILIRLECIGERQQAEIPSGAGGIIDVTPQPKQLSAGPEQLTEGSDDTGN